MGVGSSLVEVAAGAARTSGATQLVCDARRAQAGFYERLGFTRAGEKIKYGLPYVRMQLPLFPEP